jgi:hypothetical protein
MHRLTNFVRSDLLAMMPFNMKHSLAQKKELLFSPVSYRRSVITAFMLLTKNSSAPQTGGFQL